MVAENLKMCEMESATEERGLQAKEGSPSCWRQPGGAQAARMGNVGARGCPERERGPHSAGPRPLSPLSLNESCSVSVSMLQFLLGVLFLLDRRYRCLKKVWETVTMGHARGLSWGQLGVGLEVRKDFSGNPGQGPEYAKALRQG